MSHWLPFFSHMWGNHFIPIAFFAHNISFISRGKEESQLKLCLNISIYTYIKSTMYHDSERNKHQIAQRVRFLMYTQIYIHIKLNCRAMSDYIKGCSLCSEQAIAFYYSYPEHFCDDNYETPFQNGFFLLAIFSSSSIARVSPVLTFTMLLFIIWIFEKEIELATST